ncbi:unnamed protein product, partial [marine sediment metagenome]
MAAYILGQHSGSRERIGTASGVLLFLGGGSR